MRSAILNTLMCDSRFGCHLSHEAIDAGIFTRALNSEGNPGSDRNDPADDSRTKDSISRKAKRDRPTGHDFGLELLRRNPFEKALVVTSPRTEHPVLLADALERSDDRFLIAEVKVDRSSDVGGIKLSRDILFECNKVRRGHLVVGNFRKRLRVIKR